ncbi:MAG: RES domain-containing protein [Nitrospiraceae bacterium]|nr:RES domain-containing protein [Nitrospiraceae bacterium]
MITLFRLVKTKHLAQAFDGQGAKKHGGRWNEPGVLMVYTSGSLSLAAHETFVHLGYDSVSLSFVYIPVEVPDSVAARAVNEADLPADWKVEPPPDSTKQIGTEWALSAETAVLKVPSIIIPGEFNYLLNPDHPDFALLKIKPALPFQFDPRLLKK